ncbi:ProQ/FinO family protein [uncultured Thiodictyon sp.]|uniref:ProQ/FinO family protein n=1 Tax=uncultured Thiodictyon sp. TaxID=1846217 RepID=UPI0025FA42A3|nr:ProQ/FinO family protein [uncultured Thiodictyon sp.]
MTNPTPELLALRDAFPLAFPAENAAVRPLAIGIRDVILAWADTRPDLDPKQVAEALRHHCARVTYRRTVVAGAMRIDLQGQPVAPVTQEAAALAAEGIERDRVMAAQAVINREMRRTAALEQQAKIQAAAEARRAKQAAKAPKQKAKKTPQPAAEAPAPKPAPKPAPTSKSAAAVVVKKRRAIPKGE